MRLGGRRIHVGRIARILLVVAASVDRFALPHRVGCCELVAAVGVRVWTARETRNRCEGVEKCREIPLETRRGVRLAEDYGARGEDCWGIICEYGCSARSGGPGLVGAARRGGEQL